MGARESVRVVSRLSSGARSKDAPATCNLVW